MEDDHVREMILLNIQPELTFIAEQICKRTRLPLRELVILCIELDDPTWAHLIEKMPQQARDETLKILGSKMTIVALTRDMFCDRVPGIAHVLEELREEALKGVVLADGGYLIFDVPQSVH